MKHFTPERYLRLQSRDDEVADAADAEWEAEAAKYREAYRAIEKKLPSGVVRLLEDHYLHDAEVTILGIASDRVFTILVKPETTPDETLALEYALRRPPIVRKGLFPDEFRDSRRAWLCDEVDLGGDADSYAHRILLSNGESLTIEFGDLRVTTYHDVDAPAEPDRAVPIGSEPTIGAPS